MKGKPEVLEILQKALAEELQAINQYFLHAEMQSNWGYKRLYAEIKKQAIGEMKHAEVLIERILFLEGLPNMNDMPKIKVGKSVEDLLEVLLKDEEEHVDFLESQLSMTKELGLANYLAQQMHGAA